MTDPDHKPERVYAEPMPCPFCGGEGSVNEGRDGAFVHCVDCLASTNILCPHNLSKAEAIEDWNTRVTEPHPQAPAAEIGGEVTQAFCNKCGFVGVPDDCGFHHRPKDGVMCNYTAHATPATERPTDPVIAALRAQLAERDRELEEARELLRDLEPHLDAIVCYASTTEEHDPNRIAVAVRSLLASKEKNDV